MYDDANYLRSIGVTTIRVYAVTSGWCQKIWTAVTLFLVSAGVALEIVCALTFSHNPCHYWNVYGIFDIWSFRKRGWYFKRHKFSQTHGYALHLWTSSSPSRLTKRKYCHLVTRVRIDSDPWVPQRYENSMRQWRVSHPSILSQSHTKRLFHTSWCDCHHCNMAAHNSDY